MLHIIVRFVQFWLKVTAPKSPLLFFPNQIPLKSSFFLDSPKPALAAKYSKGSSLLALKIFYCSLLNLP